ncbi:hypothetical protein [Thioalkalivibrio sp. HK1]|uniref:hypothetical protein n=1 Tax=Thioalkalivibrio sp. HK1 TaxID=1469245 RepID=UPI0004718EA0|nr:hypothetical protein [Thioalkalivibrio sp. HK1]
MAIDTIEAIEKTIDSRYRLKRKSRDWLLDESDNRIRIRVPDRNSIAFSLDKKNERPFAFFSGNPPEGIAKICDAFLFCIYEGKGYLFIIEVKSAHKERSEKQLINGKFFCDWLLSLCREHGYLNIEFSVVSLLLWEPRDREVTYQLASGRRSDNEDPDIERKPKTKHFCLRLEVKNRRQIALQELMSYVTVS